MEAVGFAASIIGIIQLTGKLTSMGYGYIGTYRRAAEDHRNLIAELKLLEQVLVLLQRQDSQDSPAVQKLYEKGGAIETCSQGLHSLELELQKKGRKAKLMWPLKEKDTLQYIAFIERQKTTFLLAIGTDSLSLSKGIDEGIRDTNLAMIVLQHSIQAEQIAKMREKILNWLYSQKVDEKHLEISGKRQKNTGEWLLKTPQFQGLIKGQLNSRLLWGYGIAGAGKSFLSSVVIDYLQAQAPTENYGLAYIYFDYKEQSRQTPINVLASLVKQLASQIPYVPAEVEVWHGKIGYRSPTYEELYTALLAILKSFAQVFFVFDALDECDQNTQRGGLLPLFQRMGKSGINLFLTSREYPDDIQFSLRDAAKIELAPKKEDITAYIESKIDENIRASRLVQQAQCKDRIISEVLDCSQGMFLLAQFHVEYICQQVTINQILKALDKIKSSSTGLTPTYDRAMKNIRGQAKPSANLAFKILSWLVKARRKLTVDEIRVALSIESDQSELDEGDLVDKETLLDVCASLVTIDENSNTIHLAHYTVQEYLMSKSIIPTDAEPQIAMACITFLSFDIFAIDVPTNIKTLKSRYDSHPFLKYAAEELDLHLGICREERLLTDKVLTLIQKPENISFYLQVLHLRLLSQDQVNYPANFLSTPPIHAASIIGYCGSVREFLQGVGSPPVRDNTGQTALHMAAGWGREAVVQLLLEGGVDPSIQDNWGQTALHAAVLQGHNEIIRILLEKGANSSIKDSLRGYTALHTAAEKVAGSEETIQVLLGMGVDSSILNNEGQTALHIASSGNAESFRILLEMGADHSITDNRGRTALHEATRWGRENVVQLLLEKGADPSVQDNAGQTALYVAASTFGAKETVVRLLLENGADYSIPNNNGKTALHEAASSSNENIVQLLLDEGADPSVPDNKGGTALHAAVSSPNEKIVKLLLEKGAELSAKNEAGETALDMAMDLGKETVVQSLLDRGAEFSVPHGDWREIVRAKSSKIQSETGKESELVIKQYGLPDRQEVKLSRYSYYHQRLCAFIESLHVSFFPFFSMLPLFSSILTLSPMLKLFLVGLIIALFFTYFGSYKFL